MKTLKLVGLLVLTALTLSAVPATSSASGGIEASTYPVTYKGFDAGEQLFHTIGHAGFTECPMVSLEGGASGPVGTLSTSAWMSCGGKELKMNGCKFELRPGTENALRIGPPGCGPITGLVMTGLGCEVNIPSQTLPATFTNTTSGGKEVVKMEVSSLIQHTYAKWCAYEGEIEYVGDWEIRGYNGVGNQVNIRTKDGFNALVIVGQKSEDPSKQPKFSAESYPNKISGTLNTGEKLTFSMPWTSPIACSATQFNAELTALSATLPVTPSGVSGCKYGTSEAVVTATMNSCYFTYGVANADVFPPVLYKGTVGIACSKAGDKIKFSHPDCNMYIGAQSPTSAVQYQNGGSGTERYVQFNSTSMEGVNYTIEGLCQFVAPKEASNGKVTIGVFKLRGD